VLKLLVAIDGSAQALRALEVVGRWARSGVPLEIVLVNVRAPADFGDDLAPAHREAVTSAQQRLQDRRLRDAEARALGCGVALRAAMALEGAPAQEIVRAAAGYGVDQIVMGTHGTDAVGGGSLVAGSVAQRVLCLSRLPVLLVP
jgi:nucleotide-binding universal stress UspA family protein